MINATNVPGLKCALVVATAICGHGSLHATVVEPLSDAELAYEAGFIVHGHVTGAVSRWNDHQSQIFTYVDIAVDRQLKGEPLGKVVSLRVLGGFAEGIGMAIADAPTFEVGEETVLFLDRNPQAILPVVGMSAGKFTVRSDASTGVKIVQERGVELNAFLRQLGLIAGGGAAPRAGRPAPPREPGKGGGIAGQNANCPNAGIDCCTGLGPGSGGAGCSNNDCCNIVCDLDPFCCNVLWDGFCAGEAQTNCPFLCLPGPSSSATTYKFRLEGVAGTANALAGPPLAPHATPPFLHFDLREFPDCIVPYSFYDGTLDLPGLDEFGAVDAAFTTWSDVAPSLITFDLRAPGPGAMCPLIKDQHNMIGWNGINCAIVGDDTCLVPANGTDDVALIALVCGGICAANAALIDPGADATFQAAPNNCLGNCAGDDFEDNTVVPPVIRDGGNGIIESVVVDQGCECHFRLSAQMNIVGPGADGWLTTSPNNCCDDVVRSGLRNGVPYFGIWDGGNGLRETMAQGGDMDVADQSPVADNTSCYCRCKRFQLLVIYGTLAQTAPNNCCDDAVVNISPVNTPPVYRIRDGGDLRVTTKPGLALGNGTYALTANFYEGPREGGPNSGRILESDILFNDFHNWQIYLDNAGMPAGPDVETVALHEIGHFIGLHHATDGGASNVAGGQVMSPFLDPNGPSMQTLQSGDEAGVNFLYTPDLGDAPDPAGAVFNEYQTLVHSTTAGRTLNDVQLFKPGAGPVHLFGYGQAAALAEVPRFEWLGDDENGDEDECEALVPVQDDFDDGVTLVDSDGNEVARLTRGADNYFKVVISHTGLDGRYVNAANAPRRRLYVNGFLDLDGDDVFDTDTPGPSDLEMWWGGIPDPCTTFQSLHLIGNPVCDDNADPKTITLKFKVAIPAGAPDTVYARFRLDWGEDVGDVASLPSGTSGDLRDSEGTAQFGEVEDYAFDANGGAPCPWDCAQAPNGIIDTVDFLALLQGWGLSGGNGPCDFDNNGIVNTVDFLDLLQNWGPCH